MLSVSARVTLVVGSLALLASTVGLATPAQAAGSLPCDVLGQSNTPCVAAYSSVRALYSNYNGPLYQVQRASDNALANIGLLSTGGYVNAAQQDSFCNATTCTITELYDQSSEGNNLTVEGPGQNGPQNVGADATALPITINGNEAYGVALESGVGYRNDSTHGIPINSQPQGMYMVTSGTNVNDQCCSDFGNVETGNNDTGAGHMDALNVSLLCGFPPCSGSGPWVEADLENGVYQGSGSNTSDPSNPNAFVTAVLNNNGTSTFELEGGNATSGGLTTFYNGPLPPGGYAPMSQEGALVLGTGGDDTNHGTASFFEGVVTAGFPSSAADAAVQINIVAAGYSGTTNPVASFNPSVAGPAVVHAAGATGAGAAGFSSVYTVDSSNGDLQETYLPYFGHGYTTQDLSALAGTPSVMAGTQPVALVHCGYTSVYTVDAHNGDLQETYLAAIGGSWTTQDLSAIYGTPPTNVTPTAVVHLAGATGAAATCGFTSVYTVDALNGDLQETYLTYIGHSWTTQDLSAISGAPSVQAGTSPVAIGHCGYTSVFTVDANHDLQETYLAAISGSWATHDLSTLAGTPATTTTPTAVVHYAGVTGGAAGCGFTSVYTVNDSNRNLQETYLIYIGHSWTTQNLSTLAGTPPVAPGTQPVALYHTDYHNNYTSVFTVDQGSDQLQETYLSAVGASWRTQNLSVIYGTPPTDQTPIVLLRPDSSGNITFTSVYSIDEFSNDLQETSLPGVGSSWTTQDLSSAYGTPTVAVQQSSQASWSVDHAGYTSLYTVDASTGDLQETYLQAMNDSWVTQDLTGLAHTPTVRPGTFPVALFHDGYTSVYTVDASTGDLQETYLPNIGASWTTIDLTALAHTPPTDMSPTTVFHDGYTSVYTVDASNGDLQETYLSHIGASWITQDLSVNYHVPPVQTATSPVALFHSGFTSVFTVDASGDLQETYLTALSNAWITQDLTTTYGTPSTRFSPTAVFHDSFTSVFTVDASGDLQETYLPAIGDRWVTQDLTTKYGAPSVQNGTSPIALYHTGYTSVYTIDAPTGHLKETYLPAINDSWITQDLSANFHTPNPQVAYPLSAVVHYAVNGGLTFTSVYTVDAAPAGDVQETYLPAINDSWTTQDLTSIYHTPPAT